MTAESTLSLTRNQRKKLELRRDIISAAFDCFTEHGYHATGIADVAARLGIGHGTFYRYFENKRDIVDHVVTDTIERVVGALADQNAPGTADTLAAYRDQCQRICDTLTEIFTRDPRVPRLLLLEAPGVDPQMRERILDFLDTAADLNAAYLRHGVAQGFLRADLDPADTARVINGMILAAALDAVRHPEAEHQRQLTSTIMAIMFEGVAG